MRWKALTILGLVAAGSALVTAQIAIKPAPTVQVSPAPPALPATGVAVGLAPGVKAYTCPEYFRVRRSTNNVDWEDLEDFQGEGITNSYPAPAVMIADLSGETGSLASYSIAPITKEQYLQTATNRVKARRGHGIIILPKLNQ